jgi:hypothetical protein
MDKNIPQPVSLINQIEDLGFQNLADSYIDILESRREELAFCIGYSPRRDESLALLKKIHTSLDNQSLRDIAKGCIEVNNITAFSFLLEEAGLDVSSDPLLLSECIYLKRQELAALLVTHDVDIEPLTYINSKGTAQPIVDVLPLDMPEIERRWYKCLPSIVLQNNADLTFACSALGGKTIPDNVLELIKKSGNTDMCITLIEFGHDFDDISSCIDKELLPELQSKYLRHLTESKLENPSKTITIPSVNF